jgi:hypothetical protein
MGMAHVRKIGVNLNTLLEPLERKALPVDGGWGQEFIW